MYMKFFQNYAQKHVYGFLNILKAIEQLKKLDKDQLKKKIILVPPLKRKMTFR